jgi:thiol-disulfide isomerase/thioredoxin
MKIATTVISTVVVLIISLSCALMTTPVPPTLVPSLVPATHTPEPATAPIVASIAAPTEAPTEAPVNLDAPYYDENAIPQQDITSALAKSAKDGKLILLDFGANWCPDCLVLTKLFEDPAVKPFLEENFRMVRIDVGYWDKNLDISEQYGNPIANGIPAVVVLAPSGEIIATTKDGALANARTATPRDILEYLQTWVALKP